MGKLTKEEKEEQKFKKIEAEMKFDSLAKQYKGKPFSTEGICTLRRYWLNYLDYRVLLYIETNSFYILLILLGTIKNESNIIILAAFSFWFLFVFFVVELHMSFLRIQRFRSLGLNPWLIFIPLYANFVSLFIPNKISLINNKYFIQKIKFKPLFITVMILRQILHLLLVYFIIFNFLIGEI